MEMLSSFRGDKHEFCLVVIKFKHVRSCPSFDITIHDCIEWSSSDILSGGADICNCKSSANEWCMIDCESIMADKGLLYMVKSIGP